MHLVFSLMLLVAFMPSILAAVTFGPLWRYKPFPCMRFVVTAPLGMIAKLVTWALALPVAALSVAAGWVNLPTGLNWMQTHDNPLDYGAVQEGWRDDTWYRRIWSRARWLWRNPAYGALHRWFGAYEGNEVETRLPGSPWTEGLERFYTTNCVMVRGRLGPLYLLLGWKVFFADADGRRMMAVGISRWKY